MSRRFLQIVVALIHDILADKDGVSVLQSLIRFLPIVICESGLLRQVV